MVSNDGLLEPSSRNNESLRVEISACIALSGSKAGWDDGGGVRTLWADSVAAAHADECRLADFDRACGELIYRVELNAGVRVKREVREDALTAALATVGSMF